MTIAQLPQSKPSFSTDAADEKDEKNSIAIAEHASASSGEGKAHKQLYNAHIDISGVDEAKLMRKLDMWLVPWLSFLYLLSFLDRSNIGSARVSRSSDRNRRETDRPEQQLYGLEKAIHIDDTQYGLCLTIFFISYAIFEVCLTRCNNLDR